MAVNATAARTAERTKQNEAEMDPTSGKKNTFLYFTMAAFFLSVGFTLFLPEKKLSAVVLLCVFFPSSSFFQNGDETKEKRVKSLDLVFERRTRRKESIQRA